MAVVGIAVALRPVGPLAMRCAFHAATGMWCPGCGTTRSMRALLQLDVRTAVLLQPLLPIAALAALAVLARAAPVIRRRTGSATERRLAIGAAVLVLALTAARNLPGPLHRALGPS